MEMTDKIEDLKQVREALGVSVVRDDMDEAALSVVYQCINMLDRIIEGNALPETHPWKSILCQLRNCFDSDQSEYGSRLLDELTVILSDPTPVATEKVDVEMHIKTKGNENGNDG